MPKYKDIAGRRFGDLTALHLDDEATGHHKRWICRCGLCGSERSYFATNLLATPRGTRNCGCRRAEASAAKRKEERDRRMRMRHAMIMRSKREDADRSRRADRVRRGLLRRLHPGTHTSWYQVIKCCTQPGTPDYPDYGGRGIRVCKRWRSFVLFVADMGPRPAGTTLDRIDRRGNFEPGNCRWSTPRERNRNGGRARLTAAIASSIIFDPASNAELGRRYGVTATAIYAVRTGRTWADVTKMA